MPGIVLGSWDLSANKTGNASGSTGVYVGVWGDQATNKNGDNDDGNDGDDKYISLNSVLEDEKGRRKSLLGRTELRGLEACADER